MAQQIALPEEELARKAGAIKTLSKGGFVAQGVAGIIVVVLCLLEPSIPFVPLLLVAISAMFISFASYWLARVGKVKLAGYCFSIGFTIYTAIVTLFFWGFAGPIPIIYLFGILAAGMVIKMRASFFIAALATLLYLAMIPVEQAGILPQVIVQDVKGDIALYVIVSLRIILFYLIAFLGWFAASRLNRALQDTRRYAGELQTANEKLQASEEELRAFNEELEAANEELRATEEELRSSNEEMEAANEELRETQEQLVRSGKLAAIGQLAGGVGHELRNPLGAIKNAVYYIKGKVAKSELAQQEPRIMEFLDIMDDEVTSSNKIISDLLGFSRVGKPAVSPVRIEKVINDAISHTHIPENVELTKKVDAGLSEVGIDTDQIRQVFVNMLTNAVQAMPEGGKLSIIAGQNDGFLDVEIADTGCGMSEETLGKIFDPLFTLKAKGIGLGLAVCKSIIDRHEGSIEVKSKEGEGTTFTVKLPLNTK